MSKLAAALRLAQMGLRVFPLRVNGKLPRHEAYYDLATTDAATVRAWWLDPVLGLEHDWNIGVLTGNGLVALDIDVKNGKRGAQSLLALEIEHGDLPPTLTFRTPTGGTHYLFHSPAELASSASKIGKDIDLRGYHGYVAGPGSTIDGCAYSVIQERDVAPIPTWLCAAASKADTRERGEREAAVFHLDSEAAVAAAVAFLSTGADPAVEGAAGDATTFRVMAQLKDMGVSQTKAVELALEHWNERCAPPWSAEDLERKAANAYRYGQNAPGAKTPEADFGPADTPLPVGNKQLNPVLPMEPSALPKREWILAPVIARRYLTVLIAPPGVGKTNLSLAMAAAIVSGRGEIVGMPVNEKTRVACWNNEDDHDEMMRRLMALKKHHKLQWADLSIDGGAGLFINTGEQSRFMVAGKGGADGRKVVPQDADTVVEELIAKNVGVLIVDPFVETHPFDENDNTLMAQVAAIYRDIAKRANCAVVLVHHTRKHPAGSSDSHIGNMDSGRGASALMGAARLVYTLYGMSEADAKRFNIIEADRHLFVRLDSAKANIALVDHKAKWFKRVSVPLTDDLDAEQIGALEPVNLGRPANEEDALLRDVIAATAGAAEAGTGDIIDSLKAMPMYEGMEREAMRKRILRAIGEDGAAIDGVKITVKARPEGAARQWKNILVFTPQTQN